MIAARESYGLLIAGRPWLASLFVRWLHQFSGANPIEVLKPPENRVGMPPPLHPHTGQRPAKLGV